MRVTILFEETMEDDGVEGFKMVSQDNIELTTDLMLVYAEAARAAGFTYVDRVGYSTVEGAQTWGPF